MSIASRKQEHIKQITERCLFAQKKNLVSRNELSEIENIGARDLDMLKPLLYVETFS